MTILSKTTRQKIAAFSSKAWKRIKPMLPLIIFAAVCLFPSVANAQATTNEMTTAGNDVALAMCKIIPMFKPVGYGIAILTAVIGFVMWMGGNREGIAKAVTVLLAAVILANIVTIIKPFLSGKLTEACFTEAAK